MSQTTILKNVTLAVSWYLDDGMLPNVRKMSFAAFKDLEKGTSGKLINLPLNYSSNGSISTSLSTGGYMDDANPETQQSFAGNGDAMCLNFDTCYR